MPSEAAARADFTSFIRYAQVWEDADILLEALDVQPGHVCVSIASAGDNALALLARGPARVVALDLNPAQLACVELRVAAFRTLEHGELLGLIGSQQASAARRLEWYRRCRAALGETARNFWDARAGAIAQGIGAVGKFENYFRLFRERVLPLVHSRARVDALLAGGRDDRAAREKFYESEWNTWRWRLLFKLFFSRFAMGRLGRDPALFHYVEGSVAERILNRARHALVALDPAQNPYLRCILTGTHGDVLPFALRAENFAAIRANLDRLECRQQSLEDFLAAGAPASLDRFNLSDIFEYMSEENYHALLARLADASRPGARLAYWNMLAPRRRPESLAARLRPLDVLANDLHARDKAFFYSAFVVEEVIG
ncbi:MAG: DUF3419 family protein [Verrucomicrobia bacterium]|nr:DUF3419 family protein [Verrucomicrobiota bacterium]